MIIPVWRRIDARARRMQKFYSARFMFGSIRGHRPPLIGRLNYYYYFSQRPKTAIKVSDFMAQKSAQRFCFVSGKFCENLQTKGGGCDGCHRTIELAPCKKFIPFSFKWGAIDQWQLPAEIGCDSVQRVESRLMSDASTKKKLRQFVRHYCRRTL